MAGSNDVPTKQGRKHRKVRCSMALDEIDPAAGGKRQRAVREDQLDLKSSITKAAASVSSPVQQKQTPAQIIKELSLSTSMKPCDSKEARYLAISNGIAIYLLDLKCGKEAQPLINADYVPPLPILTILNLSAGLFKLGTHTYIIHGHLIHSLSLAAHSDNTATLTLSKPDNMPHSLSTPQIGPTVEEIDGQIHVFDSASHQTSPPHPDYIVLHEVVVHPHEVAVVVPPIGMAGCLIKSHLVLGTRIHAATLCKRYLVFSSRTRKWKERRPFQKYIIWHLSSAPHVWNILDKGIARCIGVCGRFYVVIGIAEASTPPYSSPPHCYFDENPESTHAVAFLVNSRGWVVCTQDLPHFFEGPVQPHEMRTGSMFKVDQKTTCAIINAGAFLNESEFDHRQDYLFIYTFGVEILAGAVEAAEMNDVGRLDLEEFVHLFPKERFVYKTDARQQGKTEELISFRAIQACFV